jgi:hypothetical protein
MTVKRINETTIQVGNVVFSKSNYGEHYVSFSTDCTEDHCDSMEMFLEMENSEGIKPPAMEYLLDLPIYLG